MTNAQLIKNPHTDPLPLLPFEAVEVQCEASGPVLRVTVEVPGSGLVPSLIPRTYVHRPQWWGIEVVGRPGNLVSHAHLDLSIPISGTLGVHGIEVIGAQSTELIEVRAELRSRAA